MTSARDVPHPRSTEEQWEHLLVTLELATRFELVLVASATDEARAKLRARLRYACAREGRPFLEPEHGEDGLDWLTRLRGTAEASKGPLPVLFYPFPVDPDPELFTLHRLNENRDNLRSQKRGIRGMLVLAGGPGLLRAAAREAPDLWSIRSRAFEVMDLELPADLPPDLAPETSSPAPALKVVAEPWQHEAFLSCAYRDRQPIDVLRDALKLSGVPNVVVDEAVFPGDGIDFPTAAAESRTLVLAMSPDFLHEVWPKAEPLFGDDPASTSRRVILLMLRPCVVPLVLRGLPTFDWTTSSGRAAGYLELFERISGVRPDGTRVPTAPPEDVVLGEGSTLANGGSSPAGVGAPQSGVPSNLPAAPGGPEVSARAVLLVARETEIYSPPWPWWKKGAALLLASLAMTCLLVIHDHFTAAEKVFPAFGIGTLSVEAGDNSAALVGIRCNGVCLHNRPTGVALEVREWKSGPARMVLEKPLGIGSVDLEHPVSASAVDLTLQVAGRATGGVFTITLVDGDGKRERFTCDATDPEDHFRSHRFVLGATLLQPDSEGRLGGVLDLDLEHVDRIEIELPFPEASGPDDGYGLPDRLDIEGIVDLRDEGASECPPMRPRTSAP